MSTGPYETFQTSADIAGLLPEEVQTLWEISNELDRYTCYDERRHKSGLIEAQFPDHVQFESERTYASDGRPIGVATVWSGDRQGATAYLEGRQHALEAVGSDTTSVLMQLFARHPSILRRFGYASVRGCDHIDPAGEAMQTWGPELPANLSEYGLGAWRGAWADQHSWRYATPTYHGGDPETELSTALLRENPEFFGALHGTSFASYAVISSRDQSLATDLSSALHASGRSLNRDQPEAPNTPIHATAVFGALNKEQFDERREASQKPQAGEGGTSALDVVGPGTLVLAPEIAFVESAAGDRPSGATRLDAIRTRAQLINDTARHITHALEILESWCSDHMDSPTVQRLYDAGVWYSNALPGIARAQVEAAEHSTNAHAPLTNAEIPQIIGPFGPEALAYAGNMHRLARQAGNVALGETLEHHIQQGAELLGPIRPVPVSEQVALQALLVLIGMRHAGQR